MSRRRTRIRRQKHKTRASTIVLRVLATLVIVTLIVTMAGVVSAYALVRSWLKDLPDYQSKNAFQVAQATKIYSADGKLLARLYLQNREVVPMSEIATDLVEGIVAVEDERYYQHGGVDPQGIVRAVVSNAAGGGRQGASTITQQYIRNTILLDERTKMTIARKIREAYLAMELEKRFSKKQILEMYLNTVYFGEGAYGAEAASRTYFAKSAKDLTLPEAALIAGLVQSPSRLDPYQNPTGAVTRRNKVLSDMADNGYITAEEYKSAVDTKLTLKRMTEPENGIYYAPYYVQFVKKQLQKQFTPSVVFQGGLTVYTSLDTRLQGIAEQTTKQALKKPSDPAVALVAMDPRTGYVKAMVGGRDFTKSKFNLATQAYRQPGSAFKTFVLVTALEQGMPPWYSVDSAAPVEIPSKPKPWVVDNSEGSGTGMMSLDTATALSVNAVFARVAWAVGIKEIAHTAQRMGIVTTIPDYPSIALGAKNVTPLEMCSAYCTLAANGTHYAPIAVTKVVDRDGATIFNATPQGTQVLKPEIAHAATEMLKGVIQFGTASRADIGRPAAGKTGTSQENRDNWFVGYTPQLSTAVWVGYPVERTIYVNGSKGFGGTVAAPIWATFMRKALGNAPKLDFANAKEPHWDTSKFDIPVSSATINAEAAARKAADAKKKASAAKSGSKNSGGTGGGTTPPPTPDPGGGDGGSTPPTGTP
jgi:penicillin-binding protein 2D